MLAKDGIPLSARTWHSLLQGGGDDGFFFRRGNPLPYRVLIGDKSSMVDCDLASAILRARANGPLMLWVGDVYQLAPVGHGAPLRDMIAAGLRAMATRRTTTRGRAVPGILVTSCLFTRPKGLNAIRRSSGSCAGQSRKRESAKCVR